jgi:adenosylhomocysteine nucleosidase
LIRLGIVAALPAEVRTLTRKSITVGSVCELSDEVLLAWSGIGAKRARPAAERLLGHGAPALLSWGCAAALSERLAPGSLLLPSTVVAADGAVFRVDAGWHARLCAGTAKRFPTATGALVETRVLLTEPRQKHALCKRTGAIAADMESAALAAVAQEAGVGFMAIRAVADGADMVIPRVAIKAVDDCGRLALAGLLAGLICYPQEWRHLGRLSRGFHAAQATLAAVAAYARPSLLVSPEPGED